MSLICFSPLTTARCYGDDWSKVQHIVSYIPSGAEILVLFPLVAITYTRPSATLILLTLEILVHIGLSTWAFAIRVDPPDLSMYKTNDTALAIVSPIPLLLFHIFLTSYLLHIRPELPQSFRTNSSTVLFSIVVAPLIPIAFVAGLMPVFFTSALTYRNVFRGDRSLGGGVGVEVRYEVGTDEHWARIVGSVGASCGAMYVLCGMIVTIVNGRLAAQQTSSRRIRSHRLGLGPSGGGRCAITLGLLLAAVELGISIMKPSFALIILRRSLGLTARIALTAGLIILARHDGVSISDQSTSEMLTTKHREEEGAATKLGVNGNTGRGPRETIATFGTPSSFLAYQFGGPPDVGDGVSNSRIDRRPSLVSRRNNSKRNGKGSSKSGPSRLVIGGPVKGSFKRLQTGLKDNGDGDGRRDWYGLPSAKFGLGVGMVMVGAQMSGFGSPVGERYVRERALDTDAKETLKARPPALSFRGSTFTASSLDKLVSTLRHSIPASNNDRNRPQPPHEEPYSHSAGLISTSTATTFKKNVGSIYDPETISVAESELARWPPSPPDAKKTRGGGGGGEAHLSRPIISTAADTREWSSATTHAEIPPAAFDRSQQNMSTRLVSSTAATPPPPKRGNSIKRKPVPNFVSPTANSAILPLALPERDRKEVRVSTYFTSRMPTRDESSSDGHSVLAARSGRNQGGPREGRKRSGTATERGVWYAPTPAPPPASASSRRSMTRSTIHSAPSEYNEDEQSTTATRMRTLHIPMQTPGRERPSLGRRRSTDPALAILAPLDFPLPPSTQEKYDKARRSTAAATATINRRHQATRSMVSPTSLYSHTENDVDADDRTCPCAHEDAKLFYRTPIQSPDFDQEAREKWPSPPVPRPAPALASRDQDPFRSSQESIHLPLQAQEAEPAESGRYIRQSELQGVLARLTRIQRETGTNMDFETASIGTDGRGEIYFDERGFDETGNRGSVLTFASSAMDSMLLGSEDLTPVAGIYTGQSFGPRI
ncbi:hypothetical protein I316_06614 [Kwoniella heveanensis BCC8398]|uniref:Uncharacterized protein n=1 Tax=Kwoniella heveanensis BCC8398 TaxID=1296120 RepID=A0A1B9GLC3_9TREE|nr:hypothetical protein I316_06614 [Kwoniella heveanensis BCC8398]